MPYSVPFEIGSATNQQTKQSLQDVDISPAQYMKIKKLPIVGNLWVTKNINKLFTIQ
tara:strand:+ start:2152 stop:2322 length:171 start_codon:yes stop_codon:yes gene_type:complete